MFKLSPYRKSMIYGPNGIYPHGLQPQWKRHGFMKGSFSKCQGSWQKKKMQYKICCVNKN